MSLVFVELANAVVTQSGPTWAAVMQMIAEVSDNDEDIGIMSPLLWIFHLRTTRC